MRTIGCSAVGFLVFFSSAGATRAAVQIDDGVRLDEASGFCRSFVYQDVPVGGGDSDAVTLVFMQHVAMYSTRSNCAKLLTFSALDLRTEALQLAEENRALNTGQLDKAAIEKTQSRGPEVKAAFEARLAESRELSSESKKLLVPAIAYYALSVRDGLKFFKAAKDYSLYSFDVLRSAGLLQKAKLAIQLKGAMGFMRTAPGAVKASGETFRALLSFAKAHEVEVSADDAKSLDALGSIDEKAIKGAGW